MRFDYIRRETSVPIYSLGNASHRFLPLLQVQIVGPGGPSLSTWAKLDSGADDTVFPAWMASRLSIDLADAPEHTSQGVGGHAVRYRYAEVEFRLTDHDQMFVWNAIIGFGEEVKRPILGHAGVMQFFDVEFLGEAKQMIIHPNRAYSGQIRTRTVI